jgi:hypothetical protein
MSIPVLLTNYLEAKARRDDTMRLTSRGGCEQQNGAPGQDLKGGCTVDT